MENWENILAKMAFILLILAALGPLLGRATFGQILILGLALTSGLFFLGDLVLMPWILRFSHNWAAAAGDGLFSALVIRYISPALGAGFGWGAAILLGAAIGTSEFFLHRWAGPITARGNLR